MTKDNYNIYRAERNLELLTFLQTHKKAVVYDHTRLQSGWNELELLLSQELLINKLIEEQQQDDEEIKKTLSY